MPITCYYHAVSNLQIKAIPEDVHAELRRRAADEGLTLRDYVLRLIERDLALPSKAEFLRRLQALPPGPEIDGAEWVREAREERMAELAARDDEFKARLRGHDAAGG
jgi:hypothetical protein